MDEINNIRSINSDLYHHYNSTTMKRIALRNLKTFVSSFFKINVDELSEDP